MTDFQSFVSKFSELVDVSPARVEVFTADPVDSSIVDTLRSQFGEQVVIVQTIDPKIVDGIKLKIGDLVVDSSAQKQLVDLGADLAKVEGDDIFEQMKQKVLGFNPASNSYEEGTISEIKDGVCVIKGLENCMYMEQLELPGGVLAIALNLNSDSVGGVIMGEYTHIKEGDKVARTGNLAQIGVGDQVVGRIVDPTGKAIDGKGDLEYSQYNPVEKIAPGVMARTPVDTPMQTGITSIDALFPIGRGQRELILGDRQTGKTSIALDAIISQKGNGVKCIYVAVGQKASKVARAVAQLEELGAMDYTTVVAAGASEPAGMSFLAPYAGVAIGEYFADKGEDVLIVYDDLTKHAIAYRELSLLLKRPPGREAFPGDVFYLHSRLLERACNLNEDNGGGSITALPIVETQAGDISAFVPTNVISITDGQIFLETDLFNKGQRPAINVGLSVSRVGSAAQTKAMKKVAGSMKLSLAQFREMESFAQFGSDLDEGTKQQINRGQKTLEVLKQTNYYPKSLAKMVISIFAANNGIFDEIELGKVKEIENGLIDYTRNNYEDLYDNLESGKWSDEAPEEMSRISQEYLKTLS